MAIATSKKTVAKWEHGVTPDPSAQRLLAIVFDVPEGTVRSRAWPRWLPSGRVADVSRAWTVAGALSSLQDVSTTAEIDRRTFLALTGPALLLPVHSWLIQRVPEAVGAVRGQRVASATAKRIQRVAKELRLLDEQLGGGAVQEIVKEHLRLVIAVLHRATYTDEVGRQLFIAAAELSQMAGFHEFDLGRHSAAQQYYLGGLRAAHASGDQALGAHVLSFLAGLPKITGT